LHPQLPVIFISGYAAPAGLANDAVEYRLIRKPFSPSELRQQIEAALAEARSRALAT